MPERRIELRQRGLKSVPRRQEILGRRGLELLLISPFIRLRRCECVFGLDPAVAIEVREALRLLFKAEGVDAISVDSPRAALDTLKKERFDAALIDLNYARDTTSGQEGLDLLADRLTDEKLGRYVKVVRDDVKTGTGLSDAFARQGVFPPIYVTSVLAGEKSYRKTQNWLPDDTVKATVDFRVSIKGPLTTPVGGGIRSLNVALRQLMDLYQCIRPVKYYAGVPSPVKHPELVDIVIFRENTEDIYAGIEFKEGTPEAAKFIAFVNDDMLKGTKKKVRLDSGVGVKPISITGSKRLVRAAIE